MDIKQFTIKIDDIENAPDKILKIKFEEFIDGIKSVKPVKAFLKATSLDEFIKITGHIQGAVILECDLCLNEFEYKLDFKINELFAKNSLQEEYSQETELKDGQFVTDLNGSREIDIYDLLYQSVILDFPNKKVCGINCKGGDIFIRDENSSQVESDPRMAVFKKINVKRKM